MKKLLSSIIPSLALLLVQIPCLGAETEGLPSWVNELQTMVAQSFHTKIERSRINSRDYIENKEYAVIRLQGKGRLKEVPDPFAVMGKLFLSNGWKEDWKYAADGHGSSSMAYRKGIYFCIASVGIDSSCDDEETGHVPSLFWFSIDCRESDVARQ